MSHRDQIQALPHANSDTSLILNAGRVDHVALIFSDKPYHHYTMSKENFVRTKPHVNIVEPLRDILDGAECSLCVPSRPDDLGNVLPALEAHRLFVGGLSFSSDGDGNGFSWKHYFDDFHATTTTPPTRRSFRNLMTKGELIDVIVKYTTGDSNRVAASFNLTDCEPVKWEIRPDANGFAEEALHFECQSIDLN
jgi:hypothetical protein